MDVALRHFDERDCEFIRQYFQSEPLELISEFNKLEHNGLYFEMLAIQTDCGLAGYASLYGVENDKSAVSLGITINAEYQGKGIGTKTINILFDKARRLGYQKAVAQARQNNTVSLKLINKSGFILLNESVSRAGEKLYNYEKLLS